MHTKWLHISPRLRLDCHPSSFFCSLFLSWIKSSFHLLSASLSQGNPLLSSSWSKSINVETPLIPSVRVCEHVCVCVCVWDRMGVVQTDEDFYQLTPYHIFCQVLTNTVNLSVCNCVCVCVCVCIILSFQVKLLFNTSIHVYICAVCAQLLSSVSPKTPKRTSDPSDWTECVWCVNCLIHNKTGFEPSTRLVPCGEGFFLFLASVL